MPQRKMSKDELGGWNPDRDCWGCGLVNGAADWIELEDQPTDQLSG